MGWIGHPLQAYLRERRADLLREAERERRLRSAPRQRSRLARALPALGLVALAAAAAALVWL